MGRGPPLHKGGTSNGFLVFSWLSNIHHSYHLIFINANIGVLKHVYLDKAQNKGHLLPIKKPGCCGDCGGGSGGEQREGKW